MRNPFKPSTSQSFFWRHGAYSYDPVTETPEQGRKRSAVDSADAESRGIEAGLSFQWEVDPEVDSSSFSNSRPHWSLWICLCHGPDGEILASLCAIDLGRDKDPWSSHYRRVVESELASEALLELESTK